MDEEAYATAVEEAFIAERGTPFLLSPKDWRLIREWRTRGIPADTVVRAVREAFERRRSRGATGKISSISYCAGAVDERWEMERRGLVGSRPAEPHEPEGVAGRLERLRAAFCAARAVVPAGIEPEAFEAATGKALRALESLDPLSGFDAVEDELAKVEAALAKGLKGGLLSGAAAAVADAVAAAMAESDGLSSQAREKVRRALERREIRRLSGLPPVTLFDT